MYLNVSTSFPGLMAHFFLLPNSILLNVLFVYSPTEEHLECLHFGDQEKWCSKNSEGVFLVDISLQISWIQLYEGVLLDYMVRLYLSLEETVKLSSKLKPFCFSQQQWMKVPLLCHLPGIW